MKNSGQAQGDKSNVNAGPSKLLKWSWLLGGLGGALVVGIAWVATDLAHPGNPVTAKVGSTQIRQSQLEDKLETSAGSSTLEQMIVNQLVTDAAKKDNITASQSEISSALANVEAEYGITDSSQLSQFLEQNGITEDDFNQMLKIQVLAQKLSERGVKVSDKDIQSYYNAHKSDFVPSGSKSKKPQPLSKVKIQIKEILLQSKATPSDQLIAKLAKQEKITIYDSKYSSVKSLIENPTSTSNTTTNTTASSNSTSNSN